MVVQRWEKGEGEGGRLQASIAFRIIPVTRVNIFDQGGRMSIVVADMTSFLLLTPSCPFIGTKDEANE